MLGAVPFFSKKIGTTKARDLGVTYTEADLKRVDSAVGHVSKVDPNLAAIPGEIKYEGQVKVNSKITNAEATAQVNRWYTSWEKTPIKDVQVKVADNGDVEVSGLLLIDRLYDYAIFLGYTQADVDQVMSYFGLIAMKELPFYTKFTGTVNNNVVTINVTTVQIAWIPLPMSMIEPILPEFETFITKRIVSVPGLSVTDLHFENGQIVFVGTVPETTTTKP